MFCAVLVLSGCISPRLPGHRSLSTTAHGYTIVTDTVRAGKQAQRFEVRAGDCGADAVWSDCDNDRERSEFSVSEFFAPGDDRWIGFSLFLPANFPSSPTVSTTLGQIHQQGGPTGKAMGLPSFPPLLQLNARGEAYTACVHILTGSAGNVSDRCRYIQLAKLSDMRGRWTDVLLHFDSRNEKSLIEMHINGRRVGKLENFVNFWPRKYYVKYGIYRSFVSQNGAPMPTQTAWFDEVRIGHTRASVEVDPVEPVD